MVVVVVSVAVALALALAVAVDPGCFAVEAACHTIALIGATTPTEFGTEMRDVCSWVLLAVEYCL